MIHSRRPIEVCQRRWYLGSEKREISEKKREAISQRIKELRRKKDPRRESRIGLTNWTRTVDELASMGVGMHLIECRDEEPAAEGAKRESVNAERRESAKEKEESRPTRERLAERILPDRTMSSTCSRERSQVPKGFCPPSRTGERSERERRNELSSGS